MAVGHRKLRMSVMLLAFLLVPFVFTSCFGKRDVSVHGKGRTSGRKSAGKRYPAVKRYGQITADSVNIRAGASLNYEILGKLNNGDRVGITSTAYGWHEIELPPECLGWIHSSYVSTDGTPSPENRVVGVVTGDKVRIRAFPALRHSVLSQVDKGDSVTVVEVKDEWFGIEPTPGCTGWVSSDFVRTLSH